MKVNPPFTAALAFVILFLCDGHNCCIEARDMAAGGVGSETVTLTDGSDVTSAVLISVVPVEVPQQGKQAVHLSKTSTRSDPTTKKAKAIRRTRITTAASLGVLLTALLGLMLAAIKLQQCRQKLVTNTNETTEGHTRRRLAEGGSGKDECGTGYSLGLHQQEHHAPQREEAVTFEAKLAKAIADFEAQSAALREKLADVKAQSAALREELADFKAVCAWDAAVIVVE